MKEQTQALEHASVKQYCKALRVPMIGAHFVQLAEQAIKEQRSHIGYLEALLTMESEERDRHAVQQRLRDAKLPRLKTLEEFDFNQARQIPAAKIRELAEGGYIERAEPVVLMGECGTGKTHWPRAVRGRAPRAADTRSLVRTIFPLLGVGTWYAVLSTAVVLFGLGRNPKHAHNGFEKEPSWPLHINPMWCCKTLCVSVL